MYMLDRNQESLGYFSLANSIFDCELGPFHNRTLVSAQNMKKAGRGYFNNVPEFPTLWETYEEEDKGVKKSKEAPKKKKKWKLFLFILLIYINIIYLFIYFLN